MSVNSQLILPHSTTTIGSTPPSSTTPQSSSTNGSIINQRLQLYNSLFGESKSKLCKETGLPLTQSLNYSLYTFLHLNDSNWILAMISIDQFDNIKAKLGDSNANRKIIQVGTVIKNFCENDPRKLKGFRININNNNNNTSADNVRDITDDDDNSNLFSILMYCYPKLDLSNKYILKLMAKIKQQTDQTVSIGIAKMNEWETFEQWKQRAIKNLIKVQNGTATTVIENNGAFCSDIDVKYINPKQYANDQVDDKKEQEATKTFGTKEEFDGKMKEIANNEDYNWIAAIMEIDNLETFLFNHNRNNSMNSNIIATQIEKEMYDLFDIYGNGINKNEQKYFGYALKNRNGTFGMILYDSKDIDKCFLPAHELIETLKEEIAIKFDFTVSIGSSRLIEDDWGMSDDWYERVNNNVKTAAKNGGNQVCFGTSDSDDDHDDKKNDGDSLQMDQPADRIQATSLQSIEVWHGC